MTDDEKIAYLKRSYSAVDGLWFMVVEEAFGFDKALELDKKVWEVMPKIQARFLKSLNNGATDLAALKAAFAEKLEMDGCTFDIQDKPGGFDACITACPWHENMIRSGRQHLSSTIGDTICSAEYAGWGKEFGESINVSINSRICHGDNTCRVCFHLNS